MITLKLILFVELLKCQLFFCRLCLAYELYVLLLIFFSILLSDVIVILVNSLILLQSFFIHLLAFSLLLDFNLIDDSDVLLHELFVSELFCLFLL